MDPELFKFEQLDGQANSTSFYTPPSDENIADSSIAGSVSSGPGLGSLISFASSGLGGFGDILAGNESKDAYDYNAQLALEQGQFEVSDLDVAEADTLSTQKAMYAKAGVTMSGSPLDTATQTAYGYEMDKRIATYNSESKSNMLKYEGQVSQNNSKVKAGEQLLSGAGKLALAFL